MTIQIMSKYTRTESGLVLFGYVLVVRWRFSFLLEFIVSRIYDKLLE